METNKRKSTKVPFLVALLLIVLVGAVAIIAVIMQKSDNTQRVQYKEYAGTTFKFSYPADWNQDTEVPAVDNNIALVKHTTSGGSYAIVASAVTNNEKLSVQKYTNQLLDSVDALPNADTTQIEKTEIAGQPATRIEYSYQEIGSGIGMATMVVIDYKGSFIRLQYVANSVDFQREVATFDQIVSSLQLI